MAADIASFGFEDVPRAEKASRVRSVFDRVASRYDLMNDLMSGGMHRLWKDAAVARLNPRPGEVILDVAGGTGDIARRIRKRVEAARARTGGDPARIIISDINEEMLEAGRRRGEDGLEWQAADAEALPFADRMADAFVISFGIRNVTDVQQALHEAYRVLKPGGRFVCLEFSRMAIGGVGGLYDAYSFQVIPRIGKLVARDEAAYRYLVESIRRFPDQETFAGMIRSAGFARVSWRNFAGGVVALHWGFKPGGLKGS
ncbi:MAG: class I SAM-dependent methyltransferase [Hyphomonadaceae bacterium]|nr:class I SAM-dependent methyltransferase [Hyphomonadaceae bacterium]